MYGIKTRTQGGCGAVEQVHEAGQHPVRNYSLRAPRTALDNCEKKSNYLQTPPAGLGLAAWEAGHLQARHHPHQLLRRQ